MSNSRTQPTWAVVCFDLLRIEPVFATLFAITLMWGAYLLVGHVMADQNFRSDVPPWVLSAYAWLFWPTTIISSLALVVGSIRSGAPILMGLLMMACAAFGERFDVMVPFAIATGLTLTIRVAVWRAFAKQG